MDVYQISDQTPSAPAADEALGMLIDIAHDRGRTLGADETISHDDALAAIDQVAAVCAIKGRADLPTIGLPADP